jgi:hypothetical protein
MFKIYKRKTLLHDIIHELRQKLCSVQWYSGTQSDKANCVTSFTIKLGEIT